LNAAVIDEDKAGEEHPTINASDDSGDIPKPKQIISITNLDSP